MENLWGDLQLFSSETKNPREVMEEQASFFNDMDQNLARIHVVKRVLTESGKRTFRNYGEGIQGDFVYSFDLGSEYLEEYTYEVFCVYYGIKFYPLCIQLSAGIEEELEEYLEEMDCLDGNKHRYIVENEEVFMEMLRKILSTNELGTIVRNINLLAKEQKEMGDTV